MQRVTADRRWPLFDVAATRRLEHAAAASLPAHTLMQRAGLATARLALAVAPHARHVWLACGPGNNGGDGLEAALHLRQWGKQVTVTLASAPEAFPPDAAMAWRRARQAGVPVARDPPADWDLCVDALLGIGTARPLQGPIAALVARINVACRPVLAVDVPTGLAADTGDGEAVRASHTLSLLTLKPGLFTGGGRDAAGQVWFDGLGVAAPADTASAWCSGPPLATPRAHASHKGTWGDVAVIGGAPGMEGAAALAATAALHAGAGRVFLGALSDARGPAAAEVMLRDWSTLPLESLAVACGCGGGAAVASVLPQVLTRAKSLVLDADGLNAVAAEPALQAQLRAREGSTVLTPHPLEAARLLGATTREVQSDRLGSARELAQRFRCTVLLKGSGSVAAAPGRPPALNPTGNARLATGGTGDVLAGWVAAALAAGTPAFEAACGVAYRHGQVADGWISPRTLTAGDLARAATPL
ncbi:MAG TPA: NAD(P)H-hydrate dehydratase [Ramlibacter sp.]|jgi:hydroxyethylthiazole kinase-like uncharacterized protein yjeF|uniref:NAD(P)H-hydrate dehydratase n=1 Tax=Ramlibacter sp. TaxID=1917967 RepID=UPI002D3B60A8|nr:NAD(P)H-hydrate dehydratase [Ramlibacter sp.]HZY18183.1 NAD(P)H-hydrate dehydratase [Ramlibacter sp.]